MEIWIVKKQEERGDDSNEITFICACLNEEVANRVIAEEEAKPGKSWYVSYLKTKIIVRE